ncbi:hypothetical protein [Nostoc sp.]
MNDSYKTTRSLLSIPINDTLITDPTAIAGVKLMRGLTWVEY